MSVTGAFDDQTASAVTGFQQKYASQILTPSGLTNGTGYVGKATRTKLNSLFGCGVISAPLPTPIPINGGPLTISPSGNIQNYVSPGQSKVLIGSYSLTASQAEGVSLSNLDLAVGSAYFQNVQMYINGSQFGGAWASPTIGASHTFVGLSPATITAGATATVQVFADISSDASGQVASAATVMGCVASGMTTNISITCNTASGPGLTFTGGADTGPWVEVQPTNMQFVAAPGTSNSQVSPQTLTVYTSASVTAFNVTVSSIPNWLQMSAPPYSSNTPITVTVLPNGLAAGSYSGTITISSPTNQFLPIVVPVMLTVTSITSTQPLTILSPATGTIWAQGTTQNIQWQTASPGQPVGMALLFVPKR